MRIDIRLNFQNTPAVRLGIYVGKRWRRELISIIALRHDVKHLEKLEESAELVGLVNHIFEKRIDALHRRLFESQAYTGIDNHLPYGVELIAQEEIVLLEIPVKLYGYFFHILALTFVLFPSMFQVCARYEHKVIVANNLRTVAYYALNAACIHNKVQLEFNVAVYWISEIVFHSLCNIQTFTVCERGYFLYYVILS